MNETNLDPASPEADSVLMHRSSLREQARDLICARIITGDLEPGRVYSARSLAERLRVSPTPVREAMLDLSRDHMLVPVRNKGFLVPELSEHVLTELYELRMLLEPPSMKRLAGALEFADVDRAERLADTLELAAARGDIDGFLASDREFHLGLLSSIGNERLVDIVGSLRDQQRLYGLRQLSRLGLLEESAHEHRELLACLVKGDGLGAENLMVRHLRHTRGVWAGRHENGEVGKDVAPDEITDQEDQ